MKNYGRNIRLKCATCGGEDFDSNEDKSHIKCTLCNREYLGGYDELVELNQKNIEENVSAMKNEVGEDLQKEISEMLKKTFRGSKFMKFK